MLLGARQFFERRGAPTPSVPTARDYVQDGLIAMWDGIENAGWGVHDPNATTWKDLVGTNDLSVDSNVVWYDDCSFQGSKLPTATRENASVDWAFSEAVCDWSMIAGTADNAALFSAGLGVGNDLPTIFGNWLAWYNSGRTKYFCQFYANGRPTKYAEIESPVSDASALTGTVSSDKTNQIVWVNANQMAMLDKSVSYFYNASNVILIGSNNANGERAFRGKFFCVRLYSRVLTDSEIAANYAIDKARFNLP